jgi:pepF/M3 family oligoendopeptidase
VAWLHRCLELINETLDLYENLEAYSYSNYAVDTSCTRALHELNAVEQAAVSLNRARALFREGLAELEDRLQELVAAEPSLRRYAFFFEEEQYFFRHQMPVSQEELAAELAIPGADAWSRLQETIFSTLDAPWDDAGGTRKTLVELRGLARHPDRSVREKAYRRELEALQSMEVPLAASLNGVKGFAQSLTRRRGYDESLEQASAQSRISDAALSALIQAMGEALPDFRRYLRAKARVLGLEQLAFYDLFAPLPDDAKSEEWSLASARDYIVRSFASFSEELAEFAGHAFDAAWIDAEPRRGKVGGAFCISFPLAGESRILANFDGSFSAVSTLAHELGHAYHHEVLKDFPAIHREYPMTLAETASIFCETLVLTGAEQHAHGSEHLRVLESLLQDATQVIVDILSRFEFERNVFAERAEGEISPKRFCELMRQSQRSTYGDALDEEQLHPYMWAVKGHYYRHDNPFYNFPYAFGQLFGLSLFARFRNDPSGFPTQYRELLQMTGRASAVDVTASAGFDIETPAFWRSGLQIVTQRIDEFEKTAATLAELRE